MIVEVHANYDAEKCRNDGHSLNRTRCDYLAAEQFGSTRTYGLLSRTAALMQLLEPRPEWVVP